MKSPLLARPGVDIPGRPVMIETGAGFLLSRPSRAHYRGLGPETRLEQVAGIAWTHQPTHLPGEADRFRCPAPDNITTAHLLGPVGWPVVGRCRPKPESCSGRPSAGLGGHCWEPRVLDFFRFGERPELSKDWPIIGHFRSVELVRGLGLCVTQSERSYGDFWGTAGGRQTRCN